MEQQKVASELDKLQQVLEQKEAQMAQVLTGGGQIASLKGHYDRVLKELQGERDELKKERMELLQVTLPYQAQCCLMSCVHILSIQKFT